MYHIFYKRIKTQNKSCITLSLFLSLFVSHYFLGLGEIFLKRKRRKSEKRKGEVVGNRAAGEVGRSGEEGEEGKSEKRKREEERENERGRLGEGLRGRKERMRERGCTGDTLMVAVWVGKVVGERGRLGESKERKREGVVVGIVVVGVVGAWENWQQIFSLKIKNKKNQLRVKKRY